MHTRALASLALLLLVAPAQAAPYVSASGIEGGKSLRLARQWEPLFTEGFENGAGAFQVTNFEKNLTLGPGRDPHSGAGCLAITRPEAAGDTAWELTSPSFAVPAGRAFLLSFSCRHDLDLRRVQGHKELYWTRMVWLDDAGQEIGNAPFAFGEPAPTWHREEVTGTVPARAARALLRLGFDHPNLSGGSYLHLDDLRCAVRPDLARYVSEGEMLSRPIHLAEAAATAGVVRLLCRAETPPKTAVRLQVRAAADAGGAPRPWSAWCGPDGTAQSYYAAAGGPLPPALAGRPWLQYRLKVSTQDAPRTPAVRAAGFSVGKREILDTSWDGPDTLPPALVRLSSGRVPRGDLPIRFALKDEGVGVDAASVAVSLDGKAITAHLRREPDGAYLYAPEPPLKPLAAWPGFLGWTTMNHGGALAIGRAEAREPGGAPAMLLRGPEAARDTAFSLASPPIPAQEGAAYHLRWWSRHTMAVGTAGAGKGTYSTGFTWLDAKGQEVGTPVALDQGPANPEWHLHQVTATAPAGARPARVQLGWDHPNLTGKDEVAFADVSLEGPHPDVAGLPNLHLLTVSAADLAGNRVSRDAWILVKEPLRKGVVTLREDGVTLVDGKPFFPIGIYAVWKREHNGNDLDRAFAELKEAGFNTAHTYQSARGAEFREFYAAAARHGIGLFVACRAGANNRSVETAILDVATEESEPALLAWYLADDTASHIGSEELARIHQAVRDIDPAHITVQADGVGEPAHSRYADYVASTDGFLPELYPIRGDGPDQVPHIIRDMQTVAADLRRAGPRRKAIWAIVQDFEGWGWPRFPTDAEVRAMTYLSIIHGATGMTYYTYGGTGKNHGANYDPKVWANLKRIAGELSQLHDVLVEPDPAEHASGVVTTGPAKDALGYPSLSLRLKRHAGKTYLLAASSCAEAVTAHITAPALAGRAEVLFESRALPAAAGALEDRFEPYAVHVYRW